MLRSQIYSSTAPQHPEKVCKLRLGTESGAIGCNSGKPGCTLSALTTGGDLTCTQFSAGTKAPDPFETIDIGYSSFSQLYWGCVAVGNIIYMVPYNSDSVGVLGTTNGTFSKKMNSPSMSDRQMLYRGGVVVGTRVYFVPYYNGPFNGP